MPAKPATAAVVFRSVTSPKHLELVFENRVAKGNVRGRDGMTVQAVRSDLAQTLSHVSTRCRAGTYKFTPYRERLLLKGAGKAPRVISIPTVRDRITLRALAELLDRTFPECTGKLPQTGVAEVTAALASPSYDTYVRIDVKEFFPSVNHDILIKLLRKRIRKPEILRIIRRAVSTPTAPDRAPRPRALLKSGVPQGLSISNPLAEIYVQPVDQVMANIRGISYHRFVDDILILCKASEAERVDAECRAALTKLLLSAHPRTPGGKSEVGTVVDGFNYLGYVFTSGGVGVRHSSVVRLEAHLASIHSRWRKDVQVKRTEATARFIWHRDLAVTGCIFQGVAYGWIQYFRQLDDLTVLKRLDATTARLGARYGVPLSPSPKSFMRAYWAIRHPRSRNTAYVPNFDQFDLPQMANQLIAIGVDIVPMSQDDIRESFYRIVSKAVRDLERDIGDIS